MRLLTSARTLLVAGFAAALVVLPAGAASARVIDQGTFHDEGTELVRNFCDVAGFDVEIATTVDGRFLIVTRGADQLPYYKETISGTQVISNVATGESVRIVDRVLSADHRVTDNGDGTFTVLVLATGNSVLYGTDGKAIARNPGQVRFELLVDNAGTPSDPSDDEVIEFLGVVKESTGRSDDFCPAMVAEIGS